MPGKIVITGKAKEHTDRLKAAIAMRDRKRERPKNRVIAEFSVAEFAEKMPQFPGRKGF
jgi:hypothetical protein